MEEDEKNELNEPRPDYQPAQKKRLIFSKSFEEEREYMYEHWRQLTPVERLAEAYILNQQFFSPYERYTGNRLTFD